MSKVYINTSILHTHADTFKTIFCFPLRGPLPTAPPPLPPSQTPGILDTSKPQLHPKGMGWADLARRFFGAALLPL